MFVLANARSVTITTVKIAPAKVAIAKVVVVTNHKHYALYICN
jgi:hypothetical protein